MSRAKPDNVIQFPSNIESLQRAVDNNFKVIDLDEIESVLNVISDVVHGILGDIQIIKERQAKLENCTCGANEDAE